VGGGGRIETPASGREGGVETHGWSSWEMIMDGNGRGTVGSKRKRNAGGNNGR